jgi:hypothetical protein
MTIKTTLAAIALTLAPAFALAGPGCEYGTTKMQSVSQCAVGQVFDQTTQTCITAVSS